MLQRLLMGRRRDSDHWVTRFLCQLHLPIRADHHHHRRHGGERYHVESVGELNDDSFEEVEELVLSASDLDMPVFRQLAKNASPEMNNLLNKLQQKLQELKASKEEKQLIRSISDMNFSDLNGANEAVLLTKFESLDNLKQMLQDKKYELSEKKLEVQEKKREAEELRKLNKPVPPNIKLNSIFEEALIDTKSRKKSRELPPTKPTLAAKLRRSTTTTTTATPAQGEESRSEEAHVEPTEDASTNPRPMSRSPPQPIKDGALQEILAEQTQLVGSTMREYLEHGGGDPHFDSKLSQFFSTVIDSVEMAMHSPDDAYLNPPDLKPQPALTRKTTEVAVQYPGEVKVENETAVKTAEDYVFRDYSSFITNLDDMGLLASSRPSQNRAAHRAFIKASRH
eukprot:Blabericola_migrator_1__4412@NODE_2368_length_2866_cov_49_184352_g191_i1_p1_GENE_NODE_2368_length_2866_cov_49_184352_g191_i1NODE_2368_length_2866_cov_49_184352_g191_i1_p1_ORF_typecomplete_len396_score88_45Spc7/PF08317_11/0_12RNA_pol_Rpb5_N/PF03871_14/5_6e03RNA_pol_Rpb5_N/PF03871_14/1_1RNA_pol_Rpb5_N/PF03871_14/1_9e03Spore_III_AB/PF09548_10/0_26FliJ/PF02050_16/0_825_3_exonuc/PF01367_20/9_4e025_3_exonuc/PF01367_20/1_85_3_exonuc/PF01367_20/7_2e03_NODE_2368_length_2866_cov_49_184352_g191_i1231210